MNNAKHSVDAIEVDSGTKPTGTVIWMHGLGADGHDFEPIVPELVRVSIAIQRRTTRESAHPMRSCNR
jgi:predicted esterase